MLTRRHPPHPFRRAAALSAVALLFLVGACLVPDPGDEAELTAPERSAPEAPATEDQSLANDPPTDPAAEPHFTPFTRAPDVLNRGEIGERLEETYPAELREAGIGGSTMLHFFINPQGEVENIQVAQTSGHPGLDEAAMEVARSFQFSPAENQGEAVPVWIQIPITYMAR